MRGTRKPPNIWFPAAATVLALVSLVLCLMAVANSPPTADNFIWSLALFIGMGILQWVNYFRLYVDFRIDKAMQEIALSAMAKQVATEV